jgi:hypothetical protein
MMLIIKTLISVFIIVCVTELGRKGSALGAILLALPIVSFTTYTILWFETKNTKLIADLAQNNFLYVIPVMPILPFFSWMLRSGYGFFVTLFVSILLTAVLFILFDHFMK